MGCCRGCLSVGALFVLIAGIAFWVNCLRTNAELAGYRGLITHGDETESEFVNRVTGWMEAERYAVDITALQPIVGYRNHAVFLKQHPGKSLPWWHAWGWRNIRTQAARIPAVF